MDNALVLNRNEFALKIGAKERVVAVETAVVIGGKTVQEMLKEAAFQVAARKASHGNYRAAVEIMGFAATAAQLKTCTPPTGTWTKARVLMLAELVLERKPKDPSKGWSKRALAGRAMATLIQQGPENVLPEVESAQTADPLDNVAE